MHRPVIALATALVALLAFAGTAGAAAFTVNVTYDAVDVAPGDGACKDAAGNCPLRAAVQEANALPGWDSIALPAGVFPLTVLGAGEDAAATGDLDIRTEVSIDGKGPRHTIVDGQQADRVFDLRGASVAITGVAIRNGSETHGAGIRARSSKLAARWAALYRNGAPSSGALLGTGGGIYADDTPLSLSGVTLFENRAAELGGGIWLANPGGSASSSTLENVTLHGNSARRGGGLFAHTVPTVLRNDTIAGNFSALGGGIYWLGIQPRAWNTTVSSNTGQDCQLKITSVRNNNDTDKTCGFFNPGDLPGVNPLLGPLTYLGVVLPNWVRPLAAGSPIRDAGDPATCTATDAVGQLRPLGRVCDIGAYEQP